MTLTTRKMSDRHERDVAEMLEGRMTRGSGNQFVDQMDGKQGYREQHYTFSWDGKSTLGKSISVSRAMLAKAAEQAHWARWCLPLRFYRDTRLTQVDHDLVVLELSDFADILADANRLHALREQGCSCGGDQ